MVFLKYATMAENAKDLRFSGGFAQVRGKMQYDSHCPCTADGIFALNVWEMHPSASLVITSVSDGL